MRKIFVQTADFHSIRTLLAHKKERGREVEGGMKGENERFGGTREGVFGAEEGEAEEARVWGREI